MKQALVAGVLIGRRLFYQHIQIAPACFPGRHSGYIIIIAGASVYIVQKFVDREIAGFCAEIRQHGLKIFQFFPYRPRLGFGNLCCSNQELFFCLLAVHSLPADLSPLGFLLPQLPRSIHAAILPFFSVLLISRHHPGHLIIAHAHNRRAEHRSQRNVLHGVVNNGQQT